MPLQVPVTQTGLEASIIAAAKKAGSNLSINLGTNAKSINALSQPLGRITGQADEFTKSIEAANARVLAFGASVGVLNSVVQGFKSLINVTIEVEKSLADINSVLQQSTPKLNEFKKQIFDVAKETGNSFKTVSEAALELSRQGLPANEVVVRLKDSMILARLSGLDAAQSVEGLTAAVNSFTKEGLTTSQVLNKISNAAAQFAVSERDLIEGFKRSASVAQQAGVSIDELGGIITAVQQKTARGGAVIGNSFKTIFTRIQRPESLDLLQSIGVQVVDLEGKLLPATKLLEGLASKINSLGDIEVASITEKIGGGFQIAPLIAALDDYNSKASVARGATEAFLNAGTEAYQRNAALNITLSASINKANVSLQELASTLGEIGVTQNLTNILNFFNSFVSDVQGILDGEGLGSDLAKGIIKGVGGILSGPGLAIFGAIILKLTADLIKFGTESLKTFLNIGNSAKEIKNLQGSIASTLLTNKKIQEQILGLEGNRVQQAKFFTTALNTQLATMEKMKSIAAAIAPTVYAGTKGVGAGKTKNAAGGYMPAVSQESRDINRGVGGARSGDKPVVIPNFAFGGGKKGTMVAHTGEYIVPNFARGGSAIFNRDMIASMGLPSGAQKIGAAGGFIPNFANIATETSRVNLNSIIANRSGKKSPADVAAAKKRLEELENKKLSPNNLHPINYAGSEFGMIVGQKGISTTYNRYGDEKGRVTMTQTPSSKYRIEVPVFKIKNEALKLKEVPKLTEDISKISAKAALRMSKELSGGIMPNPENIEYIRKSLNPGALGGTAGTIFEAGIAGILNSSEFEDYEKIARNSLIDFRGTYGTIKKLYGIPDSKAAKGIEAKGTDDPELISSAAEKFLKNSKGIEAFAGKAAALNASVLKKASKGFIPNFAKYIYDSDRIAPDKGATLKAVLASQVKKNLIIGPAGSGKSTLAGKMGKFLSGVGDVANASEIDILSGAARAKGGGISKNLEAIISAVNNSGGKVSYLYAKNLDILSRRAGRTVAEEGDLRSKKQLAGTTYAPLNQFDFMGYVKSKSRNFNLVNGAKGFIPNFADPLKEAIGREISAGVPASQIYVDQNSSLKNAMNPMGLMVANRRDEPAGGMQGINRARKEGANPMLYGAAGGYIPNYAPQRDPATGRFISSSTSTASSGGVDVEKPKRDLLGVFLVAQTVLSGFSSATSESTNSILKFGNIVSNSLSNFSSIALGTEAIKGLLPATSKFASYLGPAGLAIGGLTAAWSLGKGLYNELSGSNKLAAENTAKLAKAAGEAAVQLEDFDPLQQQKIQQKASDILFNLEKGKLNSGGQYLGENILSPGNVLFGESQGRLSSIGEVIDFDITEEEKTNLSKSIQLAVQRGASDANIAKIFIDNAKKGVDFFGDAISSIDKDAATKVQQQLQNLNKDLNLEDIGKNLFGKLDIKALEAIKGNSQEINKYVESTGVNSENINRLLDVEISKRKNIVELQKETADSINLQLQNTIKGLSVEATIRRRLYKEQSDSSEAEYQNNLAITKINSDITLSETEKQKALKDQELSYAKIISNLEIQKKLSLEVDEIAQSIGKLSINPENQQNNILEISKIIENFKNTSEFQNLVLDVSLGKITNIEMFKQKVEASLGEVAKSLRPEAMGALTTAYIELAKQSGVLNENAKQEANYKQKNVELDKASLDLTKNRSAYLERINLLAENQVAILERQSIIAQGKAEALDINKQIELTQLEKFGGIRKQDEFFSKQQEIEEKYFNLRLKADEAEAIRQLDIETKRALYTQDNITALMENRNSIDQVKTSIDQAKDAITQIPSSLADALSSLPVPSSLDNSSVARGMRANASLIQPTTSTIDQIYTTNNPNIKNLDQNLINGIAAIQKQYGATKLPVTSLRRTDSGQHRFGKAVDFDVSKLSDQEYKQLLNDLVQLGFRGFGDYGGAQFGGSNAPSKYPNMLHADLRQTPMAWGPNESGTSISQTNSIFENFARNTLKAVNLGGSGLPNMQGAIETLSKFEPKIKEAGDRLSSLSGTTELSSKAMEEAAKMTSDLSLQNKIATEIQSRANSKSKIGLESQAKKDIFNLQKQLEYLEQAPNTFSDGMNKAFREMDIENKNFAYKLGQEIPRMFSDGISGAIMSAIDGTTTLKDGLRSAAYEFVKTINQRMISNLANNFTSSLGNFGMNLFQNKASGGMITGGSGTKDDVPAMLMGGEFVMKKKAVSKYGIDFMDKLNNGKIPKFADGGYVDPLIGLPKEVLARLEMPKQTGPVYEQQTGEGGFFSPAITGKSIAGRENLLAYANQGITSGANDVVKSFDNGAMIGLEDQSVNLTQFALTRDSPINRAIRQDREAALGVYFQDLEREERVKEIIKQVKEQIAAEKEAERQAKKAQKKAFKRALIGLAISTVAAPLIGAAGSGFKAAFTGAGGMQNFMPAMGAGLKGIFTGGSLGGVQVGGLNNLFTGIGKGLTGNFSQASNYFKLSQIGSVEQLTAAGANSKSFSSFYGGMADVSGAPRAIPVEPFTSNSGGVSSALGSFRATAYGLASIDPTTAMDQAKADRGVAGYKGFSQTVGASGRKLEAGYSVASNYFPLGTILSINGKEYRVDDTGGMSNNVVDFFAGDDKNLYKQFANLGSINPVVIKRATGGSIPETSGIDTVPTMLSGGEFVVNRAAAQNIGTSNLQSLNAGTATVVGGGSNSNNNEIISKLNELIEVTKSKENVMVNVSAGAEAGGQNSNSTGQGQQYSASNTQKMLNKKIRDAVIQILENEKRLGGSLRR
jgi:TP901 family phage tail tape measure protein